MTYSAFENTPLRDQSGAGEESHLTDKQRQDLQEGLTQLPFGHAQVMVLRYLENLSMDDIAKRLGMEVAAVDALHYEALARLRHSAK